MKQKITVVKPDTRPIIPVWTEEQHLYILPDDLESALAALAAVQDYYQWLVNEEHRRWVNVHVSIRCLRVFEFLLPAFMYGDNVLSVHYIESDEEQAKTSFDYVVKFDADVAFKMAEQTEKHMAQMFGIFIGSDPQKMIPDLSALKKNRTPEVDVAILPFPDAFRFHEFLENNHPELNVKTVLDDFSPLLESVYNAKMVVGLRSGLTYLAAGLGKAVIEIYSPDVNRNWLSKWSHPLYQMIYAQPEQVQAELVYRAWEVLWRRLQSIRRALPASSTPTEPLTSTVASAEGT